MISVDRRKKASRWVSFLLTIAGVVIAAGLVGFITMVFKAPTKEEVTRVETQSIDRDRMQIQALDKAILLSVETSKIVNSMSTVVAEERGVLHTHIDQSNARR